MGDPFRDQLIEELEGYLGHRLMAPETMHMDDLKAIVEEMRDGDNEAIESAYNEGYRDAQIEAEDEDDIEDLQDEIAELKEKLKEVAQ